MNAAAGDDPRKVDPPEEADPRELELAQLLTDLTDRLAQGNQPDWDRLSREKAEFCEELRAMWGAVLVADGIAAASRSRSNLAEAPTAPLAADSAGSGGSQSDAERERPNLPRDFGDYTLQRELGRGGMGIVYQARQASLNRTVAVKMLLSGELASTAELERFQTEAQAAGALDHPHIVPVYEVGAYAGQAYFSMKYIGGTTLAKRLAEGPLPPREAARLLLPICEAVHFAHQHGVLHRDLKPSNILIDRRGQPHVSDFGLAKQFAADESFTRSGAVLGTPSYMPPEQAAGQRGKLSPASDVYSLGAILYQMLTGRPPFQAASPVETVLLVLEQDPLPPRLLNARADRDLEMIALRCLQKPAELRYPSAQALADDLRAYLNDEPISARSGIFTQVMARWFRETHHATVLENWGLLWMWHSLALLLICLATNGLYVLQFQAPWPYLTLWAAVGGLWAAIFWALRRRNGPVTFVERQIAHVWASSMICISLLFVVEELLDLPVLSLSPVLALVSGGVFLVKAGILSGQFYLQAALLFLTAPLMAWLQRRGASYSVTVFGVIAGACFFFPGLKYYRQRKEQERSLAARAAERAAATGGPSQPPAHGAQDDGAHDEGQR